MYKSNTSLSRVFFGGFVRMNSSQIKFNPWRQTAILLMAFGLLAAVIQPAVAFEPGAILIPAQTDDEVKQSIAQINKLSAEGKYAEAIPLAERLLGSVEKQGGPERPIVAQIADTLAGLYRTTGDFARAESLFLRALAIREKALGPEHTDVAESLNNLALLYQDKSDYVRAEPLLQRALSILERTAGANPSDVAGVSNNLGQLYYLKGDFTRAEPLFRRSLSITEKALGPEHIYVSYVLNSLATLFEAKGDYVQAETLLRRSLLIREKAQGPTHPEVAQALNNLGSLYLTRGDYVAAEPLMQRSLAIFEKGLGPESHHLVTPLNNLAGLYRLKGDFARAEPLSARALAISEKTYGREHPAVGQALNYLANLYMEKREFARAEPLYLRALAIAEKTSGTNHPIVATILSNLAGLNRSKGDLKQAEMLQLRAIAIREKALGPEHPDLAVSLDDLGITYLFQGDTGRAEPPFQRALTIFEKAYGQDHPKVFEATHDLAGLYDEKGDLASAVTFQTRSNEIVERNLALILATGSEDQKRLYLDTLSNYTDFTVSLNTRRSASSAEATRLSLTTILRRKGRALDAASDQIGALRRRLKPQDRQLLDDLSAARANLATLVLTGRGIANTKAHQEQVAKFNAEAERLEAVVSKRSAEFRANAQPVTIESVQEALPADAALIEFVLYRPFSLQGKMTERTGPPRYVAYVLKRQGPPAWIDLGDAASIDNSVTGLRKALSTPQSTNVKQVARSLDEQIMRPVRKLLGETRRVFLSPDSALNLIPFGALVDEQNRYLVENYSLTYLTSGRDFLRLQAKTDSKQGPVVIANPQFDQVSGVQSATSGEFGGRSVDLTRVQFGPLKGTSEEAQALATILPNVKVLTEGEATEGAIKRLTGPSILHVATHGFFLPDQPLETGTAVRGLGLGVKTTSGLRRENPFIRSGLALAGANKRDGKDGEDGILTALEASGLDLWGTKLVVLSACETGLGEVKNGEGVYGLRRALVLAGSESQVISLWQVSDEATRDLMVAFYKRLQAGEGRTAALSAVQLEMLRSNDQAKGGDGRGLTLGSGSKKDRSHPFFWASFIQSGDWKSMSGQESKEK